MRLIEKNAKENRIDQFSYPVPIFASRKFCGNKTIKNNQVGRCADRDKNNEPPKYRYNGCPSAYSIVFNVIYFREFVTVRELTVFSYAVFNNRTTSLLFRCVINYNNFQKRKCIGPEAYCYFIPKICDPSTNKWKKYNLSHMHS